MNRNRSDRNAYLEAKSWKADCGHKGFWKRHVSKLRRLGAKFAIRKAE